MFERECEGLSFFSVFIFLGFLINQSIIFSEKAEYNFVILPFFTTSVFSQFLFPLFN